jgi:hypothetical protein
MNSYEQEEGDDPVTKWMVSTIAILVLIEVVWHLWK